MKNTAPFVVLYAHHDEYLPPEFHAFPTPHHKPFAQLSERQQRKWKSQRMAFFLLSQLFEWYQIDKAHLNHILRTPSGRPYITDSRVDFNISHSGEWVAIIFSFGEPQKAVGIDIEHPQKTRRYLDLLHYYAQPQEIAEITDPHILPHLTDIASRFYLSWCLREAVLKSQGVGIVKLSEVQHSLRDQRITSAYCPTGTLCFHPDLPFYLAYFFEQSPAMLSLPAIFQWHDQKMIAVSHSSPILYQVN